MNSITGNELQGFVYLYLSSSRIAEGVMSYMGAGELNSAACSYIAVTLMTEPFPHPLLSLRQSLSLYLELTDLPRQSVSWRTPVSPPSTVLCFV